jgi:uncharacterized protein (UPF0335 family)
MNDVITNDSKEILKQIVSKIERLEQEKKQLLTDISDIYNEAKSHGFDTKILRKLISLRKLNSNELIEQEELLDLYKHAVGMV